MCSCAILMDVFKINQSNKLISKGMPSIHLNSLYFKFALVMCSFNGYF